MRSSNGSQVSKRRYYIGNIGTVIARWRHFVTDYFEEPCFMGDPRVQAS